MLISIETYRTFDFQEGSRPPTPPPLDVCVLEDFFFNYLNYLGLDRRKPVFGGLRITQAQTCLHIIAV